ncbi:hypothetical protein ACF0H5_003562 [Mactra antiquata]
MMLFNVCIYILTYWTTVSATDCPDLWTPYHGSCYHFDHTHYSFMDAEQYCNQHNGRLVQFETKEEIAFVKNFISYEKETSWWIGLTDGDVEGQWLWYRTDAAPEVTDWSTGEPNNYGNGEDCVEYRQVNGHWGWNDVPCGPVRASAICEIVLSEGGIVG